MMPETVWYCVAERSTKHNRTTIYNVWLYELCKMLCDSWILRHSITNYLKIGSHKRVWTTIKNRNKKETRFGSDVRISVCAFIRVRNSCDQGSQLCARTDYVTYLHVSSEQSTLDFHVSCLYLHVSESGACERNGYQEKQDSWLHCTIYSPWYSNLSDHSFQKF